MTNVRKSHRSSPASTPGGLLHKLCLAALVALFVATPLIPGESTAALGTGLPLVMLWLLLSLAWLAGHLAHGGMQGRWGWTSWALLALVGWHGLSTLIMAGQHAPRPAINMFWQWIGYALGFLMARQLVRTPAQSRAVCAVMIALAVILSAHGYHQYFVSLPEMRAQYELDPERALRDAGVSAPPGSMQRELFRQRLKSTEPIATFALANSLAGFLAPWLVVMGAILFTIRGSAQRTWRFWLLLVCIVVPLAGCLLLTKSRTGYLAVLVGAPLVALYGRASARPPGWPRPLLAAALIVILIVGAMFGGALDLEVLSEAPKSVLYRLEYWRAAAAMIGDYPWLGCGPGHFQDYYAAYKLPRASETVADPHNFLIEVWSTAGTPALAALLTMLGLFTWQVMRPREGSGAVTHEETNSNNHGTGVFSIYGGAAAGVLLAYPLGLTVGFMPAAIVLLLAVPLGTMVCWLLHDWVLHGRMSARLPAIGATVLMVNLLAAGGIGFAGVAGTLWLLMALALNQIEFRFHPSPPAISRVSVLLLLLGITVLGTACYRTAYQPVLSSRAELAQAVLMQSQGLVSEAESHYQQAARLDPYAPDAHIHLARLYHGLWLVQPEAPLARQRLERFEQYLQEALRLQQRSSTAHRQAGYLYLTVFDGTARRRYIRQAATALARAVLLSPNSNILHAELAWAEHLADNPTVAAQEAAEALRLDALNPHREQKLKERILFAEVAGGQYWDQPRLVPHGKNAEQLMHVLRNRLE